METDEYRLDDLTRTSAPKITYSKQGFRQKAKSQFSRFSKRNNQKKS